MPHATLSEQKLKNVVAKAVRAELMRFFAALLPEVSTREQREIEVAHGKPSRGSKRSKSYRVNV